MNRINSMIGIAAMVAGVAFAQKDDGKDKVIFFAGGDQTKVADSFAITTARFGMMGPAVKGAPYAADGVTETTQTLGDGTHISRQETYSIYRDGEGRVRRETGDEVWISDPGANVSYLLHTKEQTAHKMSLSHTVTFDKLSQDGGRTAKLKVEARAAGPFIVNDGPIAGGMEGGAIASAPVRDFVISSRADVKSESLGKQAMEGVEVDGTRTTTVIPQGQIGNDRPIQTVHERWESSELHVTLLSKHTDPMRGDRTERLTNVRRGEPDPALFQVPAGFKILKIEADQ